jgi:hypothetical protein
VKRLFWALCGATVTLAIGIVISVVIYTRETSGKWRFPQEQDFARAEQDFVRVTRRLGHHPSKTIYLERHPVELKPGEDDAAAGVSSVLATEVNRPIKSRGWNGSAAGWAQLVGCVTKEFAPFDVAITDKRPGDDDFILVAVGGHPADIGGKDPRVGGLAPFDGTVIPRAVVFAFSAQSGNDPQLVCETIAQEVGHAYGLDHEYLCHDVMTYLSGCGHKTFVDATAPCGERARRSCETGATTQNSFRRLVDVLGVRAPR